MASPGKETNVFFRCVGGNLIICIDACAFPYHTRNALCDMFRLAGRLPARKRTDCAGLCGSKNDRDRFFCRFALAMQTHLSVICQRLVGLSRHLTIQTNCSEIYPGPLKTPPHTSPVHTHLQLPVFSCAVLIHCVRTPVAASAHDLVAHCQVAVYI